tara:strand:+ start:1936 stop:2856 length:921 start_codon:yes stop_codon:yes gene_type:complete
MQKEFLVSVAGGLLSALMTSAILLNSGVGILLGYFGLLPIIFVGFSSGLRYLAIASCFCIASLLFFSNQVQAILYFFSMVIPAILICYLVLSRRSINAEPSDGLEIGQVLAALALLGITYLLTSLAFFTDGSLNLEERIKEMLNKVFYERMQIASAVDRKLLIGTIIPYFPSLIASSWFIMILVNAFLAQKILIGMGKNIRPEVKYSLISAPNWLYWVFAFFGIISLFSRDEIEFITQNACIISAIPFFLIGLTVFNYLAKKTKAPKTVLFIFYIFLSISSWAIAICTIIGFFEEWLRLRRKYSLE